MSTETRNSLPITPVAKRKWKAPPRQMASHSTSSKYAILHKTSKTQSTMTYFVIRVHIYYSLPSDYTLEKVVDSEENAIALASILTKCENDSEVMYIVAKQL